MTSIKLDDLLTEIKGPAPALDLSRTKLKSKQDFEKAFDKVPEYKIKPEKVRPEEVHGEGPAGWRQGVSDDQDPVYGSPLPPSMQSVILSEFYEVDIDWRMLTTARPRNRIEEEIFTRYVEMGRLQLQRFRMESEKTAQGKDWSGKIVKVVPGRGSVPETRLPNCRECGEDLCTGICQDYMYNNYARQQVDEKKKDDEGSGIDVDDDAEDKIKTKKKKKTKKRRKRRKKKDSGNGDDADDEDD